MTRLLVICLLTLFSLEVTSQNLVLNPSFETYSECPDDHSQIAFAEPWVNPAASSSFISTDFFHSCAGSGEFGLCMVCVPENIFGQQIPHTGEGYAGFYAFIEVSSPFSMTVNELLQGTLSSPLEAGEEYEVSFWISLAETSGAGIDGFDVYLSEEQVTTGFEITWEPDYSTSGTFFIDQEEWTEISFLYTAEGGEEYITLGNFTHNFYTDYQIIPGGLGTFSYYYVDDVSITNTDTEPEVYLEGTETICQGDEVMITAFNADSWAWTSVFDLDSIISTDSVLTDIPPWSTTYFLDDGENTHSFAVEVLPLPEVDLGTDQELCVGEEFLIENSVELDNYLWQDASTSSSFSATTTGWYSLTSSLNGCENSDSLWVEFQEAPVVDLGEDLIICSGDEVVITAGDDPNYEILWNTGEESNTIVVSDPGEYEFVGFDGICEFSDHITVGLEDCEMIYILPNIFTPDGSGLNETFRPIEIKNIVSGKVSIFNRWGELVFKGTDPMIKWDGADVPDGVYYYVVEVVDMVGGEHWFEGSVTVLRD